MNAVLDPTTLAVIANGLVNITNQMDATLVRMAFSPVISEGHDRSSGIYSVRGEVVAQGVSSLPLFINTMQDAVQVAIDRWPALEEGDVVVVNDPYLVGTHLQDVRLIRPVYVDGEIVLYLANTGHWADVGGMSPGSYCVTAQEIQQEGVRMPPIRIVRGGVLQDELVELVLANLRIPRNARGDLKAQLTALDVGEAQLQQFLAKYGIDTVLAAVAELHDRAEAAMRSHIRDIPDGVYHAMSRLDNDGTDDTPVEVKLAITVSGDDLVCDFSGSSGVLRGALNATIPTTKAGVFAALKHLFADVPTNAGCFVPISFIIPPDTFLNAAYPHAVSGSSAEVSSVTADATFRALAPVLAGSSSVAPENVRAGCCSTMAAYTLGGYDPLSDSQYVMYMFNGGGYGASQTEDGMAFGPLPVGIAESPSLEVMEQQYPVVFNKFALREGSGGHGERRGGFGVEYEVELLRGTASSAALMNNGKFGPWGADGAGDGARTEVSYVLDGTVLVPPLLTKIDGVEMTPGDRIRLRTPGGGGWGDPAKRPASAVQRDAELGYYADDDLDSAYGTGWH
jgi:N-methylhydantoinase B